jgi:hypothetical protein
VKELVKLGGKRVGRGFINRLDAHVLVLIQRAVKEHNGGKKTLDLVMAEYVGAKI